MINPSLYLAHLKKLEVNFFAGVPDSLLKQFCACITDTCPSDDHVITANEGGAIGLAIGNYLGTKNIPMVYLQNSGLGNIINPVLSLASPEVYGIPMLIMIGWRGEPGVKDEPQHVHQGRVMINSLDSMNIPYVILDDDQEKAILQTTEAYLLAKEKSSPVAIVVSKNTFEEYKLLKDDCELSLTREAAIKKIIELIPEDSVVVCTTGMPSRELFEHRASKKQGHHKDFLTVGGMGHASQIALGIAKSDAERSVFCLDGDGAALMHLGSMPIIGQSSASNLFHIILNNGVHDSVGGQPTVGFNIDFCGIAKASGYPSVFIVKTENEITDTLNNLKIGYGPHFIEVHVKPGNRKDIGRPTSTPAENKSAIMNYLHNTD